MCYYITATLPKNTFLENFRNLFYKHNMAFSPLTNTNVSAQLRPEELYFRATKDYCDCGTLLGSRNQMKSYQKLLKSKKVKTLRKKKWIFWLPSRRSRGLHYCIDFCTISHI